MTISKLNIMMNLMLLLAFLPASLPAQQWQQAPQLNTARFGASSVTVNERVYVMGGAGVGGALVPTVEVLDAGQSAWNDQTVPGLQTLRIDGAASVFNGKVYYTGGLTGTGEVVDTVEVYDPAQNNWQSVRKMREKRRGHALVVLNGYLVAIGGVDENDEYITDIEYYDVAEDEWEDAEDELIALRAVPFSGVFNNRFHMFGGILGAPVNDGFAGTFSPDWQISWASLPALAEARGNGSSVISRDSLFMIGGITPNGTASSAVEIYDFAQMILTNGPDLPAGRIGSTAIRRDSLIYLVGGYSSDPHNPTASVLSYNINPITGIEPTTEVPEEFVLATAYPNPFNGVVTVQVGLPESGEFQLDIFDITGRKIRSLSSGYATAGEQQYRWDARNDFGDQVSSGIFFAVYRFNGQQNVLKLIYTR